MCKYDFPFHFRLQNPKLITQGRWNLNDELSVFYLTYKISFTYYFMAGYILHTYSWARKGLYGYFGLYATNWLTTLNLISYTFNTALVIIRFIQERFFGHDLAKQRIFFKENHITIMLSWALSTTSNCMSLLVALVYWMAVHEYMPDKSSLATFVTYDTHLFIVLITILDVTVSGRPWRLAHVYLSLVLCSLYIFFQMIYILGFDGKSKDYEGKKYEDYIYSVFQWKSTPGIAIGYFVLMLVCALFVHGFFCALAVGRDNTWKRCFTINRDVAPPIKALAEDLESKTTGRSPKAEVVSLNSTYTSNDVKAAGRISQNTNAADKRHKEQWGVSEIELAELLK